MWRRLHCHERLVDIKDPSSEGICFMGDGVTALGHHSEPFIPACFSFQVLPAGLDPPISTVRRQTKPLPTVP